MVNCSSKDKLFGVVLFGFTAIVKYCEFNTVVQKPKKYYCKKASLFIVKTKQENKHEHLLNNAKRSFVLRALYFSSLRKKLRCEKPQ